MKSFFNFLLILAALGFGGCAKKIYKFENISQASFEMQKWEDFENFQDDNLTQALKTFVKSCERSAKNPTLQNVCTIAKTSDNAKTFFESNFTPFKIIDKNGRDSGKITGYYEPLLRGSYTKTEIYKYPLLKTPTQQVSIKLEKDYPNATLYKFKGLKNGEKNQVSYLSRDEIEKNIDKFEPICYVDSKIDLFFLQVQGSGKILLDTNETINVGYDSQNGYPYRSVGSQLRNDPKWSQGGVSMQKIRQWASENSDEDVTKFFGYNQSYVFFDIRKQGATGSLGVELDSLRHIAVDTKYTPLGYVVLLDTFYPMSNQKLRKIVVAGDTGGAIKGEIRADLFYGFGDIAADSAGKMSQNGKMIVLIPNELIKEKNDK
jgi:membrane-bound lytic murein transglycosylase A